jgi:hypothetical protein
VGFAPVQGGRHPGQTIQGVYLPSANFHPRVKPDEMTNRETIEAIKQAATIALGLIPGGFKIFSDGWGPTTQWFVFDGQTRYLAVPTKSSWRFKPSAIGPGVPKL